MANLECIVASVMLCSVVVNVQLVYISARTAFIHLYKYNPDMSVKYTYCTLVQVQLSYTSTNATLVHQGKQEQLMNASTSTGVVHENKYHSYRVVQVQLSHSCTASLLAQ
eukprot:175750-Pyramimonas_sp.AAC.1